MKRLVLPLLLVAVLFAGCTLQTTPATQITQNSARLNASATWKIDEWGYYWWQTKQLTPEGGWVNVSAANGGGPYWWNYGGYQNASYYPTAFGNTITGLLRDTRYAFRICAALYKSHAQELDPPITKCATPSGEFVETSHAGHAGQYQFTTLP